MNKYHVIHLDINNFRGQVDNLSDVVSFLQKSVIKELREAFPDSIGDKITKLPSALMQVHQAYGAQFIVIIDEWDAIFREDKHAEQIQKEYVTFLRGMFKDAPTKHFIKLAYLTGILPIKKFGTESALNNFKEYTMLNPGKLAEYVGFTEDEVHDLCEQYAMDFQEAKYWYDGYSFRKIKHIYNPNSVVNAMLDEDFNNYWTHTETYDSLKNYITANFDGLKESVLTMLAGGKCTVDVSTFENDMTSFSCQDDIITILIHLGYLAYDKDFRETYIPNEEIRSAFSGAIRKSNWDTVTAAITASDKLLKATWNLDEDAVAAGIESVHTANTSILTYNDENSLSLVITLAYYNAINEYTLIRELPTGKGFADMVFLPRRHSDKPAIIVELKWNQDADSAIAQIEKKQYTQVLREYSGNLLLVGINYDKKTKQHTCRIRQITTG